MCWLQGRNGPVLHLRTPFAQLYPCSGATLLKPTHRRMICGPWPPKEFQAFPFSRSWVFVQSGSLLHTWIWLLATTTQGISQSISGAGWALSILCTLPVQRPKHYVYIISAGNIQLLLGVRLACSPGRGAAPGSEQGAELSPCHGAEQLHSGWIFLLLNDGERRDSSCLTAANVLASPWKHVPNISMFSR